MSPDGSGWSPAHRRRSSSATAKTDTPGRHARDSSFTSTFSEITAVSPSEAAAQFTKSSIPPLKIAIITYGSRGDVQPYLALAKTLLSHNHTPVLFTHPKYQTLIEEAGVEFVSIGGDEGTEELYAHMVKYGLSGWKTLGWMGGAEYRKYYDEMWEGAWRGLTHSEHRWSFLLTHHLLLLGPHLAEKLNLPHISIQHFPVHSTPLLPAPFLESTSYIANNRVMRLFNKLSFRCFAYGNVWQHGDAINAFRVRRLGMRPLGVREMWHIMCGYEKRAGRSMYPMSPTLWPLTFKKGMDVLLTGHWDTPVDPDHEPPEKVKALLAKASEKGEEVVYLGFGSMPYLDPEHQLRELVTCIRQVAKPMIVGIGKEYIQNPIITSFRDSHEGSDVVFVESIPHGWLFPRDEIGCIVHHGGSGTTHAAICARKPSLIVPHFGDQFANGGMLRALKLGWGVPKGTTGKALAKEVERVMTEEGVREQCAVVGAKVKGEDGCAKAVGEIEEEWERWMHERQGKRRGSFVGWARGYDAV
ncbi:Sterol 3-beta-glucosyltransferase [Saitoella coloradoensis]